MTPLEKQIFKGKLISITGQLQAATSLAGALPPILPSAGPGVPIPTGPLVGPLSQALKIQAQATNDLVNAIKDLVDKS